MAATAPSRNFFHWMWGAGFARRGAGNCDMGAVSVPANYALLDTCARHFSAGMICQIPVSQSLPTVQANDRWMLTMNCIF